MTGASLSRWSMSYFAAAFAALIGVEVLMAAGFGFPSHAIEAPETLILVHITAIGWLSLLLLGALLQFVPVLTSKPLAYANLPAVALLFIVLGLAALVAGFAGMAGFAAGSWLPLGGAFLVAGFFLNILNLAQTMWAARPLGLPARFVAAGLTSLLGAISLGAIMAILLGGWAVSPLLARLLPDGIPVHAALGLGGWLTFTAMGVSYRLLAMFMLSPEAEHLTSRIAFWAGTAAIAVLIVGGPLCIFLGRGPAHPLIIALLLGSVSAGFYGFDMRRLYRTRKRPRIELNARMAAYAISILGAGVALLLISAGLGESSRNIGALVFLFAFGWLSGLGLAKLYKIAAFLTWLECYGPVLGKRPTPRVQDLVDEKRALPWFYLYFISTSAAFLAALLGAPIPFRLASLGMLIATFEIGVQLVHIRKLRHVAAAMLPEQGEAMPRLFLPSMKLS